MTTQRENFSDLSSRLKVESIQNLFDTKHSNSYIIYTLDQSSNEQLSHRKELFHKRVWFFYLKKKSFQILSS
jgi:hypothetical protein